MESFNLNAKQLNLHYYSDKIKTHCLKEDIDCLKLHPLPIPKISMNSRVFVFLIIVSSCWCCNARDLTVVRSYDKLPAGQAQQVEEVSRDENLCTLCLEFADEALDYLSKNKTQTEIISIFHKSCSKIPSFTQQCIILVDYYVPLFFSEVSLIQAEDFCGRFGLCENDVSTLQQLPKDKCDLCHNAVVEALLKLKDPDTELEIVELLMKACNSIGKNVKKCKRLVFEYVPIILVNAEQFIEKNDVCVLLHACDSAGVSLGTDTSMHSAS